MLCFMAAGKSTPISKFHVVDPNKLEEPFVVTGHYIDSDFWGTREEHNMLKVFANEGFWWSNIEKEASVAIDATVALLGSQMTGQKQWFSIDTLPAPYPCQVFMSHHLCMIPENLAVQ